MSREFAEEFTDTVAIDGLPSVEIEIAHNYLNRVGRTALRITVTWGDFASEEVGVHMNEQEKKALIEALSREY